MLVQQNEFKYEFDFTDKVQILERNEFNVALSDSFVRPRGRLLDVQLRCLTLFALLQRRSRTDTFKLLSYAVLHITNVLLL